ncbi:MAG: MBOAT family O-acyltransferase [Pseudomonadota bacterium]
MVFSTAAFLYFFLPLFLVSYVLLPWKNAVALAFSLFFFTWGEGAYVVLLLLVIFVNYLAGSLIAQTDDDSGRRRYLAIGVVANLLVLGYYKYWGFLLTDFFGIDADASAIPQLPLGISFFIFQSISYLIDVARREAKPARGYFDLALYIAMFPQLIAGPIVRYGSVARSLRERSIDFAAAFRGIQLFVLGLSYKVLIANHVAEVADLTFDANPAHLGQTTAWLGITAYTLQIFFDFAGYSLMAIGLGRVMGFSFPRNFNYPYIATSITEFWRRWHMSLSSWFRDYFYIPLGGNRNGPWRTYRNLVLVFLLCGLWHGAAWTFVAWGAYHGSFLVLERIGLQRLLTRVPALVGHAYLLLVVMIGWVLFRADSFAHAVSYLKAMFLGFDVRFPMMPAEVLSHENGLIMLIGLLLSLPLLEGTRWRHWDENEAGTMNPSQIVIDVILMVLLLTLCSVFVMAGTYNPFIYFRF